MGNGGQSPAPDFSTTISLNLRAPRGKGILRLPAYTPSMGKKIEFHPDAQERFEKVAKAVFKTSAVPKPAPQAPRQSSAK